MRSLYLRIWLTVVAALALFGLVSGWMVQQHLDRERVRSEGAQRERLSAWADLLERTLPPADAPRADQAMAIRDWSQRLRLPMALDDPQGQRIAAADAYLRRENEGWRALPLRLDDGRTLWVMRGARAGGAAPGPMPLPGPGLGPGGGTGPGGGMGPGAGMGPGGRMGPGMGPGAGGAGPRGAGPNAGDNLLRPPPWMAPWRLLPDGLGLALLLSLTFIGVAAGAWPVVRRLTRRLEALKLGVETFGRGELSHRVSEEGRDEVAAVAASFNRAASRVEALLRSHQSLLANASHELRSPLARLKMALSLLEEASPEQRASLRQEIHTNIAELDALVDEVLLSSRLDATSDHLAQQPVEVLGLAAEEAARVDAGVQGEELKVLGDERLLRRALRNLLENARRYGRPASAPQEARLSPAASQSRPEGAEDAEAAESSDIEVRVQRDGAMACVTVCDRGPGVPEAFRERIFEAFFRLPGHAEREGGVGLGLSLVRQIAQRHGGSVRCLPRAGGGSCFALCLPLAEAAPTAGRRA